MDMGVAVKREGGVHTRMHTYTYHTPHTERQRVKRYAIIEWLFD